MPKADAGGLKAFCNRIKSKGLQKLRWYCQMCQKQCRDENGMKCHMRSEGHIRQMRVFAENPDHILSDFSKEFEKTFLDVLSHRHGTKRIQANQVYKEYIADKHHVHMNSTQWTSLTGFIKYLGKEGRVICDETEKGWYITYIDRDPRAIARQAMAEQRQLADLDDEQRMERMIEQQLQAMQHLHEDDDDETDGVLDEAELSAQHLLIRSGEEKIELTMNLTKSNPDNKKRELKPVVFSDFIKPVGGDIGGGAAGTSTSSAHIAEKDEIEAVCEGPPLKKVALIPNTFLASKAKPTSASALGKPVSALDSLLKEEELRKKALLVKEEKECRREYWLHSGIVVKIMNKKLSDGRYYKLKAVVQKVIEQFVGEVRVLEDGKARGAIIRLDQEDLETVVPKVGSPLLILNGRGRGCKGTLLKIHEEDFNVDLKVTEGTLAGMVLNGVQYEDISKIFDEY